MFDPATLKPLITLRVVPPKQSVPTQMPMAAAALPVLAEEPTTAMQQAEVGRPQHPKKKEPQPEPTIATAAATPAPNTAVSEPASTVAAEGPATATTCNTPWLVELVKNDVSTSLGISFEHPRLGGDRVLRNGISSRVVVIDRIEDGSIAKGFEPKLRKGLHVMKVNGREVENSAEATRFLRQALGRVELLVAEPPSSQAQPAQSPAPAATGGGGSGLSAEEKAADNDDGVLLEEERCIDVTSLSSRPHAADAAAVNLSSDRYKEAEATTQIKLQGPSGVVWCVRHCKYHSCDYTRKRAAVVASSSEPVGGGAGDASGVGDGASNADAAPAAAAAAAAPPGVPSDPSGAGGSNGAAGRRGGVSNDIEDINFKFMELKRHSKRAQVCAAIAHNQSSTLTTHHSLPFACNPCPTPGAHD